MANWIDLSEKTFKIDYEDVAGTYPSGKHRLALQYDKDSITPESVKVRFKWYEVNENLTYGSDTIYILYDANNTHNLRSLYQVKPYESGKVAAYYTGAITLTKNYSSATFFLQDVWICNNGKTATTVSVSNFYDMFRADGGRRNYAYRQTAGQSLTIESSKTVATEIQTGRTAIRDNYNNTFTITATKGSSGTNNPAESITGLKWGYDTNYSSNYTSGDSIYLTFSGTGDTRTVYAKSTTTATYGKDKTATASLGIKQYLTPGAPGKPILSYKKSRLTIKENWIFNWTAATKSNNTSPIKGYRIRLYQKRGTGDFKEVTGLMYESNNPTYIMKNIYYNNTYVDRETTDCTMTLNPVDTGFLPGDKVKLSITPYTRFGNNNDGDMLFSDITQMSDEYEVRNAGIVRVKVGNAWKEGQVYVKVGNTWREAETINTKVGGAWKESE